jgi:hypothetical protein
MTIEQIRTTAALSRENPQLAGLLATRFLEQADRVFSGQATSLSGREEEIGRCEACKSTGEPRTLCSIFVIQHSVGQSVFMISTLY